MKIIPRKPYRILTGDVREVLRTLPDESVHCVVTSQPYWGLRDYGVNGQLGLEPTIELYVEHMVEVFREVRRILRKDGTLWLNMGDCYSGSWSGNSMRPEGGTQRPGKPGFQPLDQRYAKRNGSVPSGLKAKDLVGQPWRLAFALQADGWWLRSDIIWAKPNPMPESCTDRPTKSHEYVFLLTKAAKYFFDQDAVREAAQDWGTRDRTNWRGKVTTPGKPHGGCSNANHAESGRNIRSVWTIPTQPFPEAHFATFPEALPERCIRAGTSEKGCCCKCGAPWVRIVERKAMVIDRSIRTYSKGQTRSSGTMIKPPEAKTTGWRRSCKHKGEPIRCTVLDPFVGSGTTALVAIRLGRRAIGIDLNPEYTDMVEKQLAVAVRGGSRRPRKFKLKGRRRLSGKRT